LHAGDSILIVPAQPLHREIEAILIAAFGYQVEISPTDPSGPVSARELPMRIGGRDACAAADVVSGPVSSEPAVSRSKYRWYRSRDRLASRCLFRL
jgi:hypothetical protein